MCVSVFVFCVCVDISAQVGGKATLEVRGATDSQCKTHNGHGVAECTSKSRTATGHENYFDRISGSCDRIVLEPLEKADFQQEFICESLAGKHVSVTYRLKGENVKAVQSYPIFF